MRLIITALFSSVISLSVVASEPLEGEKQIYLLDKKGDALQIGTLVFSASDKGDSQYHLKMKHAAFTDYFLSMKEMKCLEGPELWCHLPYPYDNPHTVTATDLTWLSHDLLFMFKKTSEFGANFWNGIYYEIRLEGDKLVGEGKAVDLNLLAAPPESNETPPITDIHIDQLDNQQRWLPYLEIR